MSSPFDFRELEVFAAVVEHGSFTEAARRLGTNQPTVSGRIASLESALGVRLFDRGPRRTVPTRAGQALLPTARRILKARDDLHRSASRLGDEIGGELVVATSTIPASYVLPKALASLRAGAPKLRIRLLVGDSRRTLGHLRSEVAEIAVVGSAPPADNLEIETIGSDSVVLVATPELAAEHDPGRGNGAIASLPILLREDGSATRGIALTALAERGISISPQQVVLEAESNETLREGARAGLGAAFVSRLVVQQDLEAGELTALEEILPPTPRSLHLVTVRGRTLSRSAEALAELLRGD